MKDFKKLFRNSSMIIVLIVAVFFMPFNLATDAESERNAIISSIGIDKNDEGYEITLISFIPTPGQEFVESYNIISTNGETISEALIKAELQLGKVVKLFHTEVVVLGDSVINDDVISAVDYFVREESLSSSCILIGTNDSAKNLLTLVNEKEGNSGNKLTQLIMYNSNNVYSKEASIENFFAGNFSPIRNAFIAYLSLEEDDDDSVLLSNENSEKKEDGEKKINKKLKNSGEVILFKDGKKVEVLKESILHGLNYVFGNEEDQNIVVENVTTDDMKNAKAVFYIDNKKVSINTKFENNIPIFSVSMNLMLSRIEIIGEKENQSYNITYSNITEEVKNKIEMKIKTAFSNSINKMREVKCDLGGIYRIFYQRNRKDFKKYLQSLENIDDFLQNMLFEINVNVIPD